jgi:uncharacterized protein DUF6390
MMDGPQLFARYAYPPNELGYCGPEDHLALLEYGDEGVSDPGLRGLARGFDGAWPYLELIAHANGISDPLDARVVEAYWVGNRLLELVDARAMGRYLEETFRARVGQRWAMLEEVVTAGSVPHHSFHVFAVYPWVGLLRAGRAEPLHVLDRCRVRWGRVRSVDGDLAVVASRLLSWDGHALSLGPVREEAVRAASGGRAFVHDLRPGERVAMHWDWICDRLDPSREAALRRYTRLHLDMVNSRLIHPGPAAVLA